MLLSFIWFLEVLSFGCLCIFVLYSKEIIVSSYVLKYLPSAYCDSTHHIIHFSLWLFSFDFCILQDLEVWFYSSANVYPKPFEEKFFLLSVLAKLFEIIFLKNHESITAHSISFIIISTFSFNIFIGWLRCLHIYRDDDSVLLDFQMSLFTFLFPYFLTTSI